MVISLKTLPTATAQQVSDHIVAHLRKQRHRCSELRNTGLQFEKPLMSCRYHNSESSRAIRGPEACAAGCCITDEEYSPDFEGRSWEILVIDKLVPPNHQALISDYQETHDSHPPTDWEEQFQRIALRHKLRYTPPEDPLVLPRGLIVTAHPELYRFLVDNTGVGPLDGACYLYAEACRQEIVSAGHEATLRCITTALPYEPNQPYGHPTPQHAYVEVRCYNANYCLDAQGLQSLDELTEWVRSQRKWKIMPSFGSLPVTSESLKNFETCTDAHLIPELRRIVKPILEEHLYPIIWKSDLSPSRP